MAFNRDEFLEGLEPNYAMAAELLMDGLPEGFKVTDMKLTKNKVTKNTQMKEVFDMVIFDGSQNLIKKVNAKKLVRQLEKERKYGGKQPISYSF